MSSPSSPSSPSREPQKAAVEHFNSSAAQYERSTGGCTRELARDLLNLQALKSVTFPDSKVLDNACGTAIVAEEILKRCKENGTAAPTITAVDAAPNMIYLARAKFEDAPVTDKLSFAAMPGEKLDFPDNSFTHSITNLGILFFSDGEAGAKEIYRTLAPGGVAIVTTWAELGYLTRVIHPAQNLIRPCDPTFKIPIPPVWFKPDYVEERMREGGFTKVEMTEKTVHYGAPTVDDLTQLLVTSFQTLYMDWPEHERNKFIKTVGNLVKKTSSSYTMSDGQEGVGIPMRAIVAVCYK
ncbi:hypothetical protein jhhlp_000663 [Lomentospora prolificans]|uniref:Methyltransferase type 11 domain-containing protein n=1 Tax=Lomentospora prolificans TaxID=41688 RepID=A0A2N3NJ33_9PEZI|nr:hypothetical protein jhhlp_000663 [Lomentospora prolificans]